MVALKTQIFRAGLSALWFSGAARACERWTAGKGAILMLHRVQPRDAREFAPNARLSISPEYLRALLAAFRAADIDVIGMDEALARLRNPGRTRRFVCFTFDDGYRDNLEHALPVFRRFRAPFTVYATTSFVERTLAPWWVALEHVIANEAEVRWSAGPAQKSRTARGMWSGFARQTEPCGALEARPGAALEARSGAALAAQPGAALEAQSGAALEAQSGAALEAQARLVLAARSGAACGAWSCGSPKTDSRLARRTCSLCVSDGEGAPLDAEACAVRPHGAGERVLRFATKTSAAKQRAFAELSALFMQMPGAELRTQLERFMTEHGFSMRALAEREMCGWSELRDLQEAGVEIGCHAVSHGCLSHESAATVWYELSAARSLLEAKLGQPVRHLGYPYGKPEHVGPRDIAIARELGFASAVTTRAGCVFAAHAEHRHGLPRIEVTPGFEASPHYLQTIVTGLPLLARNRGRAVVLD